MKEILYFIGFTFKNFFKNTKEWIKEFLKPSTLSYVIFLIALLAWYKQAISLTIVLIITIVLYIRMEWLSGDWRRELKDKNKIKQANTDDTEHHNGNV